MTDPAIPPVSRRSQPRFRSRHRRDELARAFLDQGADYDRLRPGYPKEAADLLLRAADLRAAADGARSADEKGTAADGARSAHEKGTAAAEHVLAALSFEPRATVVDLGAGTGKLSLALADRGAEVIAVDPSRAMLDVAATGTLRTVVGTAESTGLPDACADLVTAAQAWHWFDTDAASAEAARLLRPGGTLALIWNTMDVQIPWVHRYSRIMHAGDVQKDDFAPPIAAGFVPVVREVIRWEDPMPTHDLIDLARTRSYVITASDATRAKVLANLDWYLHEHLGHVPGEVVGLPYRTDVFLFRQG